MTIVFSSKEEIDVIEKHIQTLLKRYCQKIQCNKRASEDKKKRRKREKERGKRAFEKKRDNERKH